MRSRPPDGSLGRFLRRLPVAVVIAAALWVALKRPYNVALCWAAEAVARQTEFPRAALIQPDKDHAILGRTDLRSDSGRLRISLTQIHFNFLPLLALVLALPGALARGGWKQLAYALPLLVLSHLLALIIQLKCFYAFSLGDWSTANYSNLARNVYGGLRYFFDLPVTFCLPLLLWVGAFPDRVEELVGLGAAEGA
jgi:hypothetical protein